MIEDKKKALRDVSEIFKFENWLRFYFVIEQDDDTLKLEIPAERLEAIQQAHPHLYDLAKLLDGGVIDYETSVKSVCSYVGSRLDGPKYTSTLITNTFDSREFKIEMYLFDLWIKGHEGYLDEAERSFGEWQELFEGWKNTEQVREYHQKLMVSPAQAESDPDCTTTH